MKYLVKYNQALLWPLFRLYLIITGSRIKCHIQPSDITKKKGYVIASNHQNYLDPFVICASMPYVACLKLVPIWFMGYRQLFSFVPLRWILRLWGAFPTKPIANLAYGLPYSIEVLEHKGTICIFPEGKRTYTERVEPRSGVSVLAKIPGIELIPTKINWIKTWHGPKINIIVGAPVDASDMSAAEIMDIIYAL